MQDLLHSLGLGGPEVATASTLARYDVRSHEKPPSLVLPNGIIELAENTFTVMIKGRSHWHELVQKYLTLPPDQNIRLVRDLKPEPRFRKMESEARFKHIFQFDVLFIR